MAITESKPWDTYTKNGELNPASYVSIGLFGLAEMALDELKKAGQEPTGKTVRGLAATFRHVTITAQEDWTGSSSVADAANTRMRGALRSVLETMPLPFGQPQEAWDEWVAKAIKRCTSLTSVVHYLFDGPEDPEPWAVLAAGPSLSVVPDTAETGTESAPGPAAPAARKVRPARRVVKPVPADDEDTEEAVEEAVEEVTAKAPVKAPVKAAPVRPKATVDDFDFPDDDEEDEFIA